MAGYGELGDSEYGVVSLRFDWGWLSLGIFGALVMVKWWARYLPEDSGPVVVLMIVLALAALGTLVGWLTSRRQRRFLARTGFLLNGITLAILLLVWAGFATWRMMA